MRVMICDSRRNSSRLELQHAPVSLPRALAGKGDFRFPGQVGDGRAQLVGKVGGEPGEPGKGLLQPVQHVVEGPHQPAQLLGRVGRIQPLRSRCAVMVRVESTMVRTGSRPRWRPTSRTRRGGAAEQAGIDQSVPVADDKPLVLGGLQGALDPKRPRGRSRAGMRLP